MKTGLTLFSVAALLLLGSPIASLADKTPRRDISPVPLRIKRVPGARIYGMERVCDTCPQLHLKQITVTNKYTIVDLSMQNFSVGNRSPLGWMRTAAPGAPNSFYMTDAASAKKYRLLKAEGIQITPNRTYLRPGETVHVRLTFERIPPTVTQLNLLEGDRLVGGKAGDTERYWKFKNVMLR